MNAAVARGSQCCQIGREIWPNLATLEAAPTFVSSLATSQALIRGVTVASLSLSVCSSSLCGANRQRYEHGNKPADEQLSTLSGASCWPGPGPARWQPSSRCRFLPSFLACFLPSFLPSLLPRTQAEATVEISTHGLLVSVEPLLSSWFLPCLPSFHSAQKWQLLPAEEVRVQSNP